MKIRVLLLTALGMALGSGLVSLLVVLVPLRLGAQTDGGPGSAPDGLPMDAEREIPSTSTSGEPTAPEPAPDHSKSPSNSRLPVAFKFPNALR